MATTKTLKIRNKEIPIKIDLEYETFKVGDIFFPCKEDFILFINKLTDLAEEIFDEV